jgi:hypothetical protein
MLHRTRSFPVTAFFILSAVGCTNEIAAPAAEDTVRSQIVVIGHCEAGYYRDSSGQCTPNSPPPGGEPPPPTCDPTTAVNSCDSGGGGSGGDSSDPVDPPPSDTCNTGDNRIDAPGVFGGFEELWNASLAAGSEKGAWIVAEGSTFRLIPFQNATYGACEVSINESAPAGAIGMVHTHPWRMFEYRTSCGGQTMYTGTPSPDDSAALRAFGLKVGYFLDYNGIGKYTDQSNEAAQRLERCAF